SHWVELHLDVPLCSPDGNGPRVLNRSFKVKAVKLVTCNTMSPAVSGCGWTTGVRMSLVQAKCRYCPRDMTHGSWATNQSWLSISQEWRNTQNRPKGHLWSSIDCFLPDLRF